MKAAELTAKQLDECTVQVLRAGEKMRPEVRIVRVDGQLQVLKDYGVRGTAFKRVLGTYLAGRECNALRRAGKLDGVPRVIGQPSSCSLLTEYIEAPAAPDAPGHLLTPDFFSQLRELIEQMHRLGVAHGDLKKPENILVTADGRPGIVDFTSAAVSGSNPLVALVFPLFCEDDIKAIYKLKRRCAPHLLTEHEAGLLSQRRWIERAFRWGRKYVRYAIKKLATIPSERDSIRLE